MNNKNNKQETINNMGSMESFINPINEESAADPSKLISLIAVKNLLSPKNNKTNSRIKYLQVSELTKLFLYADIFKIPIVKKIANNVLDLQISIHGLGRKELVDLVSQVSNPLEMTTKPRINSRDIFK